MTGVVWRRSSTLAFVEMDDHVAILDLAGVDPTPVVLEGTGLAIWELIDGVADSTFIVNAVARQFGAREVDIEPDIATFVNHLETRGLIEIRP